MAKSFAERMRQRAKEAEFEGGSDTLNLKEGIEFYKPHKGKNELIILPFDMDVKNNGDVPQAVYGEPWFRLPILVHFRVGAEEKRLICPRTIGKKCPICERRAQLEAQGKAKDDPEVKELAPKKRELYWVIDLEDDDKLKVYECSYFNFGKMLEEEMRSADDDSLALYFASEEGGAVVTVRMAEAKFAKQTFLEATRFDFAERDKAEEKLVKEAMKDVVPFGEVIVVKSYDELRNLLYDIGPEDEEDIEDDREEDDTPPPPRKRNRDKDDGGKSTSGPKRGSEDADEDEEEEDEPKPRRRAKDDEDAEDDEPKPKRSRKSTKEEQDEAEDDKPRSRRKPVKDDEDEEEQPKPKRKAKEPEPEDEEDDEPKKPAKGKSKSKCPAGLNFGEDCDTAEACEDCPEWMDCRDLTDKFEAKKK